MLQQVRFVLFAFLLSLSACGPMYETQYTFVPPATAEGRMCIQQCRAGQTICRQSCEIQRQSCLNDARARAMFDYQVYVNRQTAEHKPIKKSPSDFDHSYGCGTDYCQSQCDDSHRACYGDCGGQVVARQVCVFNCDAVPARPLAPASGPVSMPAVSAPGTAPSSSGPVVLPGSPEPGKRSAGSAPLCQPGQRVEAMWEGEWYDAVVTGPLNPDGRCPIHYEGYGREDDEAVGPRRLRPAQD